jgi:hypothetical protein
MEAPRHPQTQTVTVEAALSSWELVWFQGSVLAPIGGEVPARGMLRQLNPRKEPNGTRTDAPEDRARL